jgi:hypothetical protein
MYEGVDGVHPGGLEFTDLLHLQVARKLLEFEASGCHWLRDDSLFLYY